MTVLNDGAPARERVAPGAPVFLRFSARALAATRTAEPVLQLVVEPLSALEVYVSQSTAAPGADAWTWRLNNDAEDNLLLVRLADRRVAADRPFHIGVYAPARRARVTVCATVELVPLAGAPAAAAAAATRKARKPAVAASEAAAALELKLDQLRAGSPRRNRAAVVAWKVRMQGYTELQRIRRTRRRQQQRLREVEREGLQRLRREAREQAAAQQAAAATPRQRAARSLGGGGGSSSGARAAFPKHRLEPEGCWRLLVALGAAQQTWMRRAGPLLRARAEKVRRARSKKPRVPKLRLPPRPPAEAARRARRASARRMSQLQPAARSARARLEGALLHVQGDGRCWLCDKEPLPAQADAALAAHAAAEERPLKRVVWLCGNREHALCQPHVRALLQRPEVTLAEVVADPELVPVCPLPHSPRPAGGVDLPPLAADGALRAEDRRSWRAGQFVVGKAEPQPAPPYQGSRYLGRPPEFRPREPWADAPPHPVRRERGVHSTASAASLRSELAQLTSSTATLRSLGGVELESAVCVDRPGPSPSPSSSVLETIRAAPLAGLTDDEVYTARQMLRRLW